MLIDRNPMGAFGPAGGMLFGATVIMLVILPPLGMLIGCFAAVYWFRRHGRIKRVKAEAQRRVVERQRRERIAAFRSLP